MKPEEKLEKERELVSMLVVAVGFHRYSEYKEAVEMHEALRDDLWGSSSPKKLKEEFFSLLQEAQQKFR